MNREIEFRGYNPKNRKWLYGYCLVNRGKHYIVRDGIQPPSATPEDFEVEPESIGQYTGMKDRDGKKIYEGDVLEVNIAHLCKSDPNYGKRFKVVLKWWKPATAFLVFEPGKDDLVPLSWFSNAENNPVVVGNVHDNPELAKTTEQ